MMPQSFRRGSAPIFINSTLLSGCPREKWGKVHGDSNGAVAVSDPATHKAPEGYDRQTDRQTNRLSAPL